MQGNDVRPVLQGTLGNQKGSASYSFVGFVIIAICVIVAVFYLPQVFEGGGDQELAAAATAIAKKDYDKAIDLYTKYIKANPQNAAAYIGRSKAYLLKGNSEEALADANAAVQKAPGDALAYGQRALVAKVRQDYAKALEDLTKALKIDPASAWALAQRADVYSRQKDQANALKDVNIALQMKPNFVGALRLRAWILSSMGKCKEASDDFAKVAVLSPKDAFSIQDRAWFLMTCPNEKLQDPTKAMELAKQALEMTGGKDGVVQETMAEAYFRQGDPIKAAEHQKKAIELGSKECPDGSCLKEMQQRLQKYELAARQEIRHRYEILPMDGQL